MEKTFPPPLTGKNITPKQISQKAKIQCIMQKLFKILQNNVKQHVYYLLKFWLKGVNSQSGFHTKHRGSALSSNYNRRWFHLSSSNGWKVFILFSPTVSGQRLVVIKLLLQQLRLSSEYYYRANHIDVYWIGSRNVLVVSIITATAS